MAAEILHTDSYLLDQLPKNDQNAFESIYLRYWRALLDAAYKRLNDRQQAEDVVQNVFLALWNKRGCLEIRCLSAYLHTAVRYEVLKVAARSKTTTYFHSIMEDLVLDAESADTKLLSAEMMDLVLAYAQTLPKKRRDIFVLRLQDSLSTKQIADTLGITQKTAQNQLRTALDGLYARIIPSIIIILGCLPKL